MLLNLVPKSSANFNCSFCDYYTSRYSQYERHLLTAKHQKSTNQQQTATFSNAESSEYICDCGKAYKDRSGLWRHKKCCNFFSSNSSGEITAELVIEQILS